MRYGSILSGMAVAALGMAASLGSASYSIKEFGQSLNDVPMLNMSGRSGRSHANGHRGQYWKALGKRRAANVLARQARRAERLHRHSSTGRKARELVAYYA